MFCVYFIGLRAVYFDVKSYYKAFIVIFVVVTAVLLTNNVYLCTRFFKV